MKILILGKGYVGKYLSNFLTKKGHNVLNISKATINYANPSELKRYITNVEKNIDWVINCSGYTGYPNVDGCEDYFQECYYYNVTSPLYITKACNEVKVPIIHIGSGCVYTGYDKIFKEEDATNFGADCFESSTYSKTKDAFEKLSSNMERYIFRIRIPFNGIVEPKNYLYKMLKYDTLISKQNSITCVDDLIEFVEKFITHPSKIECGIFNVVNKGSVCGSEVMSMLKEYDLSNPKWKIVSIKDANFRVARSNCILSTEKLENLGLALPDVRESLNRAIYNYSINLKNTL